MTLKTIKIEDEHKWGLNYENYCNLIFTHNRFILKLIRNVTKHFDQKYDYLYTSVRPYPLQPPNLQHNMHKMSYFKYIFKNLCFRLFSCQKGILGHLK